LKTENKKEANTESKKPRHNSLGNEFFSGLILHIGLRKIHCLAHVLMRRAYKKHEVLPDRIYNDVGVAQFINKVMKKGKKTIAESIVYGAFDIIKEKTKKEPLEVFKLAIENASPLLEVKPKRIGGATYQVPMEVRGERKIALAMRWILEGARGKKGKSMDEKLSQELIDASNNEGLAIKKKADTHRMAEANKAFAHFAR